MYIFSSHHLLFMGFSFFKSFPRPTTNQMFLLTLVLFSCVLAISLALPLLDARDTHPRSTVDLGYSRYQGTLLSSGISQYLGMRYASPPLGQNRFRAPQPPQNTNITQIAQAFKPICLGTNAGLPSSQSEDCLFVNVWAPSTATPTSKLPVWVFIQGGGYVSNSNANFNGSTVVDKSGHSIIFVNFNYRVGAFGFLSSEKVRENGDLNVGLLDQRMLLHWVQQHIAQFGGDPDHVVIHGVSAGGGSIALQMTAYGGRDDGLFIGAMGESPFFPTQPRVSELEWQFDRYLNATGCSYTYGASADEAMGCLRSQSTATLQAANVASPYPGQAASPLFYFTPTIDGDFIRDYPYNLFDQGRFVDIPVMFGDDTNEGASFAANATTPDDLAMFFKNNYPQLTSADTDAINAEYPLMPALPKHAAYFPSASAAYGETTFTCPGIFMSLALAQYNDPYQVWNYRYNVLDTRNVAGGVGVPHTFELPAIFGLGNANDNPVSSYSTYNSEIVPVVMQYWISFVKELSPNPSKDTSAPRWESMGAGDGSSLRRLVLQTNATVMETIPNDQLERCLFWKSLAVKMEQ
ncbi:hypothetical protein ACMFMF_006105 [Clarireedia jacksonii]